MWFCGVILLDNWKSSRGLLVHIQITLDRPNPFCYVRSAGGLITACSMKEIYYSVWIGCPRPPSRAYHNFILNEECRDAGNYTCKEAPNFVVSDCYFGVL